MPLVAVKVQSGPKFEVFVLDQDGQCDLLDFLKGLNEKDSDRIRAYIAQTAESGLIRNTEQSKRLPNGICYWRTHRGVRVFYFTEPGAVVICTNGYVKKKNRLNEQEIKRAELWRVKYQAEKQQGTLLFEDREI